jgi:hypothetical protein
MEFFLKRHPFFPDVIRRRHALTDFGDIRGASQIPVRFLFSINKVPLHSWVWQAGLHRQENLRG